MEVGLVHRVNIDEEMQQAYLDYAMSVIVARALPDARDGLKPVHRRILYAMYDMGLRPETAYKKSARIVGEVLGKYHPHGDMAVYDAMARMAQDFSMRYLLVDGQGNFGSVDGDPPAAMRYTEARLHPLAMDILADIQKNTVDFDPNFDDTLKEPTVLPAALPNLLVNGATGIAVGMATSIPPHNLGEVVDAIHFMLEHWEDLDEVNVEDLMKFVQGPDFPTGGVILQEAGGDGLVSAYSTGRGRVTVQAAAHLEEMERGRNRIIVTELPYMTNKASLIERVAELVREETIEGIVDLRDESDRQGMRIVIELSKTADPETVLRGLYKHTPMQTTFSINMLALVNGEPHMLSLKQALRVYIEHRLEIVRRRAEFDLAKAKARAHILEGYRVALKNLDEVISLIRKAPDAETARDRLMKRFKLSDLQAQAILDMPLRRLAALERKKIEDEYKEVAALIKELESLLRSPKKMRQVVADEMTRAKDAYGDRRRTHIVHLKEGQARTSLLTSAELTPEATVWLAATAEGMVARTTDDKLPRLSGKDAPAWLVQASSRDVLYLVTESGEAAAVPVHTLPQAEKPADGLPLHKVSALGEGSRLAALFALPARERPENCFLLTATRQGMIKKSAVSELPGPSASAFTLVRVNEGDRLHSLRLTRGQDEIMLVSAAGMAIRFSEEEVRPMGLVAAGVMGMKLAANDELAGLELLPAAGELLLLAASGSGKRVKTDEFPRQGRYGQGVLAWKLPPGDFVAGAAIGKGTARVIVHLVGKAAKAIRLDEAPLLTRTARGQVLAELKGEGPVSRLSLPWGSPAEEKEDKEKKGKGEKGESGARKKAAAVEPAKPAAKKPAPEEPVKARGKAATPASDGKAPKAAVKKTTAPKAQSAAPAKAATTATARSKAKAAPSAASAAPAKAASPKAASPAKAKATPASKAKAAAEKPAPAKPSAAKQPAAKPARGKVTKASETQLAMPGLEVEKKPASAAGKTAAKGAAGKSTASQAGAAKTSSSKPDEKKPAAPAAKSTPAKSGAAKSSTPKPAVKKPGAAPSRTKPKAKKSGD